MRNKTVGNKPFKVCDFQKNREKDRSCFGLAREKGRRSSLSWTKNNESIGLRRDKTRERDDGGGGNPASKTR